MDASETSKIYISISDHVINKTGSELVSNGKLKLSLLNEIHANWQRKMIQAGVISGTVSKPVTLHTPLQTQDPNHLHVYAERGIDIDAKELEMFIMNEHGCYGEGGIDIDALFPSRELEMFKKNEYEGFYIPQKDGAGDGDADIKPNTNAPYDEEELNENDDDVEEGGGMDDDDIQHLIVCQFDHVRRKKKTTKTTRKWECTLKAGVMHINGKQILFSEAKGDFEF